VIVVTVTLNVPTPEGWEGIGLEHRVREAVEDLGSAYTSITLEEVPEED